MAKIRFTTELVEEMLFGYAEHAVRIVDARCNDDGTFEFSIEGLDVPEATEVRGELTVRHNRARERFHTLVFKAVE